METIMQSNISINLWEKNNKKLPISRTNKRRSSSSSQQPLSSEAFLRHRNKPVHQKIDDPKKLIKRGEKPVRIFWLWGLEQIGSNMTVLEYENDILIIDAGMEFADDSMPGVDYIIPDISYLIAKKKNIRSLIITHGHLDHIGAVKNIISNLDYPTIYTSPLTIGMIKRNLDLLTQILMFSNYEFSLLNSLE